ncbi:MAG: putative ABC transport system permease protein, partial [Saprospiraceae bacterium]
MIDYDKWTEIFSSIRRHKLRTFLTALSVWWGIFMLVLLIGLGNGLQNSVKHNFSDDAVNSLWIWPGRTTMPYKGLPAGRNIQMTNQDYDRIKSQIEEIDHITARFYLRGEFTVKYKKKILSYNIRCVHPDHQILENTEMTEGRFINDKDLKEFRKICVIGEVIVADVFGKDQDPIGESLTIKGVDYKIVGVFHD